jgi:hypothetical protein
MDEHFHDLSHPDIRVIDAACGGKKILVEPDPNFQIGASEDDVFYHTLLG